MFFTLKLRQLQKLTVTAAPLCRRQLVKHRLWVPFDDLKSLYKVEGIKDKALIKRTNGLVAKIKSATRLDLGRADASTRQGMADAIEAFGKHEALLLKPMVAPVRYADLHRHTPALQS